MPTVGRVLHVFQESERPVTAGTALLDVGDPADLEVVVELLSRDGAALVPGARVELEQWGGPQPLAAVAVPGSGERPVAPVYVDGEKAVTLKGDRIAEEFQALVDDYVKKNYGPGVERRARSRKKEIPIKAVA